jgi:hypothetical protein
VAGVFALKAARPRKGDGLSLLGKTVRDELSGFGGVVTGHVEYLTGCNQCLVQPRCKDDGGFVESQWLDDDRLVVTNDTVFAFPRQTAAGCDKQAPKR